MSIKRFSGKAIYQPTGKAAEYSPWACNFFTGCSNNCDYCFCKRGVMSHVWSDEPKLKKCFKDENHAIDVFRKELLANLKYLRKTGLFFSFTTDPMIPGKTFGLTLEAIHYALIMGVPIQILTKRADWIHRDTWVRMQDFFKEHAKNIAIGFTLTGRDDLEPGASLTDERIDAMRELHDLGFKTFASIEPIIMPEMSRNMIEATLEFCDLYKVGLISGKGKDFYNRDHMTHFWGWLAGKTLLGHKFYLKDSFLGYFGITREQLKGNFVNADYNLFGAEQ